MAAKPWESRLMERQTYTDASDKTPPPPPKKCLDSSNSKTSEPCSVKVRKNNVTTRISARPPHIGLAATLSSSSPSSDFQYDESSASSSICTSTTPLSGNNAAASLACDRTEDSTSGNTTRPSYMNLTKSTKAKQKNSNHYNRSQRQQQSMDEFQFLKRTAVFSNGDSKSTAGSESDPSINFSRPLYLPTYLGKRPC